jgi:hydrogenase maturation protease
MKTLILGIGNTLLSDEGIGIYVLEALQKAPPRGDDIHYLDGGTLSFTLAEAIENCDQLVVVDASELDAVAGTIKVFVNEDMDSFVSSGNKKTVHEVGLADVLSIALLSDSLPTQRALVGIQPQKIDWGDQPTPAVQAAIPSACTAIRNLLETWR